MKNIKLTLIAILAILTYVSCSDDDDNTTMPLSEGVNITLRNTLQNPGESEITYASIFGQADDAYDEFATLSNSSTEFATALAQAGTPVGDVSGLYEIDFTENGISYTVLPELNDPFWGGFAEVFGVIPSGKTDRYYFSFSEPHNIESFTSTNSSVNVRIDSENVIVVEIGEGFDVQPDASFAISLK